MKVNKILVSQPKPAIIEKSPFYELISKYGVEIDFVPFIKIEGVNLKEFRSQRIEILDYSTVIFTSRTTIDHFFRLAEEARVTIPETMKYLCSSEAVALYLQKYIVYRKRKIFFACGNTQSLVELIVKHKADKMLLTLSEPYNPELSDAMEALGIKFGQVILSRTVSSDLSGIDISAYDLLVFYSPSEISTLVSTFGKENIPFIATFGNGTAKAIVNAGICVNILAPTEQVPSMTKAIDIFMDKIASGEKIPPVELCENREVEEFIRSQESKPAKKKLTATTTVVTKR